MRSLVVIGALAVAACVPPRAPRSAAVGEDGRALELAQARLEQANAEASRLRSEIAALEGDLASDDAAIATGLASIDDLQRRIWRAGARSTPAHKR